MGINMRASIIVEADGTSAENTCDRIQAKANNAIRTTETARSKYLAYFNTAVHLANIWGNILAHNLEGTSLMAHMQVVQLALQTASAQASVTQTALSAKAAFAKGDVVRGTMLAILAASMQGLVFRMIQMQSQQQIEARRIKQATEMWNAYR